MIHIAKWKVVLVLVVCALAFLYSAPNLASPAVRAWLDSTLPAWMPTRSVNLGLDLQGGSHLLLEVDLDVVLRERADSLRTEIRDALRQNKILARTSLLPDGVRVRLNDPAASAEALRALRTIEDVEPATPESGILEVRFTTRMMRQIRDDTLSRSIEIVRRRIDETGTREPIIQRQGDDRILVQLPGLDDPQRIKDLLGTTAKMTFHKVLSDDRPGSGTLTLPMVENPLQNLPLESRPVLTGDMLTGAQPAFRDGMSVVTFRLNAVGARRFCEFSRSHIGQPFAIVLDAQVISAPVIRDAICAGAGEISGGFSVQEATDLALLLRAGALPAPLSILEERSVGPSLGADSVAAGKIASLIGLGLVILFTSVTYGLFGIFASIALFVNVALIFALLSGLQATLTLPGIAGIVLTIGIAVDANVLIFERIREEIRAGRSPMSAIDSGYSRALGTIVDASLTTLIAAVILYSFGTGPIKGFAVTLMIGILTSLFSAVMVTRLMVVAWLHRKKPSDLPI